MVVIGSGAIGMEFAYFYNAMGTKVTVIEMVDRILPVEDAAVSKEAKKLFTKQGIVFKTGWATSDVQRTGDSAVVTAHDVNDASTPRLSSAMSCWSPWVSPDAATACSATTYRWP